MKTSILKICKNLNFKQNISLKLHTRRHITVNKITYNKLRLHNYYGIGGRRIITKFVNVISR